jgi:hypothetical protein
MARGRRKSLILYRRFPAPLGKAYAMTAATAKGKRKGKNDGGIEKEK